MPGQYKRPPRSAVNDREWGWSDGRHNQTGNSYRLPVPVPYRLAPGCAGGAFGAEPSLSTRPSSRRLDRYGAVELKLLPGGLAGRRTLIGYRITRLRVRTNPISSP
jgi:hypothetical protein